MKEAAAAIVLGAPFFFWGLSQYRKSKATASWPYIQGWVFHSAVRSDFTRGDNDSADTWTYTPEVRYQYQVDRQVYQGSRITVATHGYQHPQQAQAALAYFPAETPCYVYYNPAKPQESVLVPGKTEGILPLLIGGVLLALGLAALFV
ncbi:MAG: DUF3592 domain-containing protein [Acidobacteria bacterium]|nr:DUF3592 domain-containing protein [Acidobacteriota bacterium]